MQESATTFSASMPAAHNRWFVISAVVFGFPWLLGYVALCAIIFARAGDAWRGLLIVFMLTLLTILIDVVAVISIWAAAYARGGSEVLTADDATMVIRRSALGITVPFRAKRGILDRVQPVAEVAPAKSAPHPRLELKGAHARLRFGAGLTEEEAALLETALSEFLDRTRGKHLEVTESE